MLGLPAWRTPPTGGGARSGGGPCSHWLYDYAVEGEVSAQDEHQRGWVERVHVVLVRLVITSAALADDSIHGLQNVAAVVGTEKFPTPS